MIAFDIKPRHIVRAYLVPLMVLAAVIGPLFWWFLTELAEHGWK